jgi:hypothetical protein
MPDISFIKKKIGLSYLIWLRKSNKYMMLEEPAWFVFSHIAKRYKLSTIASSCAVRYGLDTTETLAFVHDIHSGIEQMNQPTLVSRDLTQDAEIANYRIQPYSKHQYRFGTSTIEFSSENPYFESFLHPLICHLETTDNKEDVPVFELFEYNEMIVFRLDGEVKGIWSYEETHLVKGLIFMNLVNVLFDKTNDFWLMTVHASAITNGEKTILISAAPGSGKTTMAAMLQNIGYQMVSDDFVPIDRHSFRAWPMPIAMSVKQGAMSLISTIYPEIEEKPINHISPEKSVRYIYPGPNDEFLPEALPVKEFIFISYNPSVDFQWEKIDPAKAVKLLLDQSWISPSDGSAEILFDQLSRWSFYELTYSDNQKALDAISNLFSHD